MSCAAMTYALDLAYGKNYEFQFQHFIFKVSFKQHSERLWSNLNDKQSEYHAVTLNLQEVVSLSLP